MKKKIFFLIGWLGLLSLFFLIQECWAGVVVEELHRDVEGKMGRVIRYYSDDQFRTDHPDGGISTIIDFKEDRIMMIDHTSKNYVDIKFSRWEKEVAERLKKSMPDMRPKERRIAVQRTGEKALVNGFQTEKVEIRADGELIEENWMTRDVDFREVEKVMEKVARSFSKEFKVEMKEGRQIYEKLKSYGIPILVRDYTITYGLGSVVIMEVKKIEKKDLESQIFLPPAGYQRIIPDIPKK